MKTSKAKLLWLALPLCCIAACNTGLDTYSGVPGIYFAVRVESNAANADTMYRDSTILPFIVTESTDSTLDIRMKIMGVVSDKDRLFRIETVAEGTDILPEDCDPVDGEYVLKAGEVFGSIRPASGLSGKLFRTVFRKENETDPRTFRHETVGFQ